jgi:hypothetical protein
MDDEKVTERDLLTLTEASNLLGLKDFRSVKGYIKKGLLRKFKVPRHERKTFVLKSEVESLITAVEIK